MFILVSVFSLMFKSFRFIYILLSLEMMMMGMLMYNMPILSEVNFLFILIFSVSSSVIGLVTLIMSINQYGNEYVKF